MVTMAAAPVMSCPDGASGRADLVAALDAGDLDLLALRKSLQKADKDGKRPGERIGGPEREQ